MPRRSKADSERHGSRGDAAERERIEEQCQRLERRAEAAERMLRETVSTISHDLRNSLSVIVVSARMLLRSIPPDGPGRRQLEAITRAADEINQLAQDLVDAMSIENGSLKIGKGAHEVEPILDRAIELVAPTVALKPLEIAKELPHDVPPIACDRDRIVQVIANLLGNAMRFTPKGGRITVRAEPAGTDARFSISDTGPGIPSELHPLLFARHAPARRPMGQGMGLAAFVTKGIVEAHGGTIWVESSPGQGSTFFFTIPAAGLSVRSAEAERA
ncbi:sensor histidine kinase [Sorangium sp. So ce1335]|uniref:sensor histidine kinase n=1 Tax=Sorangium sp. So ce1335 TaxID=3133335 RepID=UPI003F5E4194